MHQMLVQFGYAAGVTSVTFLVHAIFIVLGRKIFIHPGHKHRRFDLTGDTVRLVFLGVWLSLGHLAEIAVWAGLYHWVGLNPTWEEAVYFALTCFTTLGFGDVIPSQDWRLLTGFTSANGLLLFGLSAAVLVDATARLRLGRRT